MKFTPAHLGGSKCCNVPIISRLPKTACLVWAGPGPKPPWTRSKTPLDQVHGENGEDGEDGDDGDDG